MCEERFSPMVTDLILTKATYLPLEPYGYDLFSTPCLRYRLGIFGRGGHNELGRKCRNFLT